MLLRVQGANVSAPLGGQHSAAGVCHQWHMAAMYRHQHPVPNYYNLCSPRALGLHAYPWTFGTVMPFIPVISATSGLLLVYPVSNLNDFSRKNTIRGQKWKVNSIMHPGNRCVISWLPGVHLFRLNHAPLMWFLNLKQDRSRAILQPYPHPSPGGSECWFFSTA